MKGLQAIILAGGLGGVTVSLFGDTTESPAPIPMAQAARAQLLPAPAPTTIGSWGHARGMRVGVAVEARDLESRGFGRVVVAHFTALTPENALKLGQHATQDGFDWSEADHIADFARSHGLGLRLHPLVWEHPDGLLPGMSALSPPACQARLRAHIEESIRRYADVLVAVDVVNEPLDPQGNLHLPRWTACLGSDPLSFAFHTAHDALLAAGRADVALVLNEYDAMEPGPKADGLWRLLRDLRARGVPVDSVGLQAHVDLAAPPTLEGMQTTMERYAQAGLRVEITELDATLRRPRADRSHLEERHARAVRDVISACLRAAGAMCSGVTSWGMSDDVHWQVRGVPGSRETPTLFDARLQPKPAYEAAVTALAPVVQARR